MNDLQPGRETGMGSSLSEMAAAGFPRYRWTATEIVREPPPAREGAG